MLDLRTIPRPHMLALINVCRGFADKGNTYFEDQGVILSRVVFGMHELREMSEYSDADLLEAVEYFITAIGGCEHIPDDDPSKLFLKYSLTAAHDELQRRGNKGKLKAVK